MSRHFAEELAAVIAPNDRPGRAAQPRLRSVRIGAAVAIEMETFDGPRQYPSRIEDVELDTLHVATPAERGTLVAVPVGTGVRLTVTTLASAPMVVQGTVTALQRAPVPVLLIRASEVDETHSHLFKRVPVLIQPEEAWVWAGTSRPPKRPRPPALESRWRPLHATVVGLGGTGLSLLTEARIATDAVLCLRIALPPFGEPLTVRGHVVAVDPAGEARATTAARYSSGMQFDDLSRTERERVVRAVNRLQLDRRRRSQV